MSKILDLLKRTLDEELAKCREELGPVDGKPVLDGPWSMLVSESGAWHNAVPLNAELYREMRGMFPDNIIREVLLAAAGMKISRTCLSESKLALLSGLAAEYNFQLVASRERYIHRRDT